MKILLLGGTGAMGAYLSELLAERGDEVYVTTRSDRESNIINYIKGNAHDNVFLKNILGTWYDAVIDFMIYNTEEFRQRVNIMLSNTNQYIFFSSSRVYAESLTPLKENSPRLLDVSNDENYLSTDEYALTKARQENILFESGKSNWTIVRPYITYSNKRLQLGTMEKERWLFRALEGKSIIFPRDVAEHITTMTYGRDVAKAILGLIGNKEALGKAVHITGSDCMKWSDVLDVYANTLEDLLGKRPNIIFLDNSSELMVKMNNEYQVKYDRLYDRVFDNSLATTLCGDIDYTSMREGLNNCLIEFVNGTRQFDNVSWRFEGWADRKCSEFSDSSRIPGWKNKCKYLIARVGVI